ncbi:hypothetical protein LguiB_020748 [Lonicera macranthoides]
MIDMCTYYLSDDYPTQVLMDDINAGYKSLGQSQVKKVNGVEVENLKHLKQLVEGCKEEENLRVDLDEEKIIVLNYGKAKTATSHILKRHRIPSPMSMDLLITTTPPHDD